MRLSIDTGCVPPALRIGSGLLLVIPGLKKFLTYEQSVVLFETLGLPEASLLVLAVGLAELVAGGLLLADRALPVAAALAVPIMVVAVGTAGPTVTNLAVLGAVLYLLASDLDIGSGSTV